MQAGPLVATSARGRTSALVSTQRIGCRYSKAHAKGLCARKGPRRVLGQAVGRPRKGRRDTAHHDHRHCRDRPCRRCHCNHRRLQCPQELRWLLLASGARLYQSVQAGRLCQRGRHHVRLCPVRSDRRPRQPRARLLRHTRRVPRIVHAHHVLGASNGAVGRPVLVLHHVKAARRVDGAVVPGSDERGHTDSMPGRGRSSQRQLGRVLRS